jgi:toxin FitB
MIILDTNVISELMRLHPSPRVMDAASVTEVVKISSQRLSFKPKIFYGIELLPEGKRRESLLAAAESVFAKELEGRVLGFDSYAARAFSKIAANRRAVGRPISQLDAQIAAIAWFHDASLATRDIADFRDCGVDVVDPWAAT